MIRILFILENLRGGGAERITLTLLKNLDRSRFTPTLFLLKHEGALCDDVPHSVRVVCAMPHGRLRYHFIPLFRSLLKEAKSNDVIVGALELLPTYLAYLAGFFLNKPSCGWVHIAMNEYMRKVPRMHHIVSRFIYNRIDYLIFVSKGAMDSMLLWLRRSHFNKRTNCRVIYNMLEMRDIQPDDSTPLPDWEQKAFEKPVILSIGRLDWQKGYDILIASHQILIKAGVKHHLVILGEGTERNRLELMTEKAGVGDSVFLPGFSFNPFHFLKKARIFVLSSRFEGFGIVLIEALAAGLPVVSTDCPSGPSEILENGKYGLLTPPQDPSSIAAAVSKLFSDDKLCASLSKEGQNRALVFSTHKIIPEWEAFFLKVSR